MPIANFDEIQLPTNIASGARGGPGFSTRVVGSDSGEELRNSRWDQPLLKFEIGQGLKHHSDMFALIAFFRARRGKARGFRFKDWSDYQAINEPVLPNAQGIYQLAKTYQDSVNPTVRFISKPVLGTITFSQPGCVLDYTTGVVTNGPPVAVYWSGEFDVPVRFDTDQMEFSIFFFDTMEWAAIPLIELRDVT